jgi:tRNA(Arg) A34 adenosine deaminase TadA
VPAGRDRGGAPAFVVIAEACSGMARGIGAQWPAGWRLGYDCRSRREPLVVQEFLVTITPEQLMRYAIDAARQGIAAGETPFGCAVALGDRVLAVAHNRVLSASDITAHAEITALREACRAHRDILLEGAQVATTCEPCPMCMAALHWARVAHVYYGATIQDARDSGFNELGLSAAELVHRGGSTVELHAGVLAGECRALFAEWLQRPDRRTY